MKATTNYDMASVPLDLSHLPEFRLSPRAPRVARAEACTRLDATPAGPMVPPTISNPRKPEGGGKADPVWVTAFTTKFQRNKVAPDAPLATPKGAARVIQSFLDRASEIAYLAESQHQELATTLSEMKANGIDGFSLSTSSVDDMESANLAETHLRKTPYAVFIPGKGDEDDRYGDMVYVANMARRIEWERFIFGCGPINRVAFTRMRDGTLGIAYEGKERDPEVILQYKRAMKARWLDSHDSLPYIEDIEHAKAHNAHLGKVVLAMMNNAERDEYLASKMYGTEDIDPGRIVFHADPDPKPQRDQYSFGDDHSHCHPHHNGCEMEGWEMYNADVDLWSTRQTDRGYAGPSGLLGLDEDAEDAPFENGEDAE